MRKIFKNNLGFTMAELLIVVAIIGVLGGVGFIAVQSQQRSMTQLDRDAVAREIFVAAQNHLSMAESQGYLGREAGAFGTEEEPSGTDGDAEEGVYYFVVGEDHSALNAIPRRGVARVVHR